MGTESIISPPLHFCPPPGRRHHVSDSDCVVMDRPSAGLRVCGLILDSDGPPDCSQAGPGRRQSESANSEDQTRKRQLGRSLP